MTSRICGGVHSPLIAQDGLRGESAHLRPTTRKPNIIIMIIIIIIIIIIRSTKEEG